MLYHFFSILFFNFFDLNPATQLVIKIIVGFNRDVLWFYFHIYLCTDIINSPVTKLLLFSRIPVLNRPVIPDNPCVHLCFHTTIWTGILLTFQVSVGITNRKRW